MGSLTSRDFDPFTFSIKASIVVFINSHTHIMTSKKADESLLRSKDIAIEYCWRQQDVGYDFQKIQLTHARYDPEKIFNSGKIPLLNVS